MNVVNRQYVAANTARCLQPSRSASARWPVITRSTHAVSPCAQLVSKGAAHGSAGFGGGCGGSTCAAAPGTHANPAAATTNTTRNRMFAPLRTRTGRSPAHRRMSDTEHYNDIATAFLRNEVAPDARTIDRRASPD